MSLEIRVLQRSTLAKSAIVAIPASPWTNVAPVWQRRAVAESISEN